MKKVAFVMFLMAGMVLTYSCRSGSEKSEQAESEEVVQADSLNQSVTEEGEEY